MSGLQKFTVSTADLVTSTYEKPVDLYNDYNRDIPMLRAMAKIEVIDHLEFAQGEAYDPKMPRMRIEKVELCGFNSTGTILPWMGNASGNYQPQWTDVSKNVTMPTVPDGNPYIVPNQFSETGYLPYTDYSRIISFYGTDRAIENNPVIGPEGFPIFTAYVPEYSRAAIGNSEKPYIVVTLTNSEGEEYEGATKQLKLVSYQNGAPQDNQPIEEMLRNHIYRYQVNSADNPQNIISVGYTVCPWYTPTVDIPSFD